MDRRGTNRIFALVAVWGLSFSIATADPLDIRQVMGLALRNNRDLAKMRLGVVSGEIDIERARTEFASSITPNVALGSDGDIASGGVGLSWSKKLMWGTRLIASANVSGSESKGDTDEAVIYQTAASVSLEQPLFENAGRLVNEEPLTVARESLRAHRRILHMQEADTIVAVAEAYVDILRLETQVSADAMFLKKMDRLNRLTKARERQGKATRVDSLRVDLQKGKAEIRLQADRERLSSRTRDLWELAGLTNRVATLKPVPHVESELPARSSAVRVALSNRLDYAQCLADERSAKRSTKIAERRLGPNLSLITRYSRYADDELGLGDDEDGRWFVGVSNSGDLLQSKERLSVRESELAHDARAKDIEIVRHAVSRQVLQALSDCRRAFAEVPISERNLDLAVSRASLARRLFETGRGDNFSVTDAEDAAFSAQTELLVSRSSAVIAMYRLRRVLGTLVDSPQELRPVAGEMHK